jgi:hypothetical protein
LNEIEQILVEGNLDLERNREQLKSIRRGEWKLEEIETYFTEKEIKLETLYTKSELQHSPDENKIKMLLLRCLEERYGSIDTLLKVDNRYISLIDDLRLIVSKYNI